MAWRELCQPSRRRGRLGLNETEGSYRGRVTQGTKRTDAASRRLAATRFLAVVIGTAVVGAAVATASAYVGGTILGSRLGDFGGLGVILLVMIVGYVLGVIAGIVVTHRLIGYRGSVWLGVVGSVLGIGIMLGLVASR